MKNKQKNKRVDRDKKNNFALFAWVLVLLGIIVLGSATAVLGYKQAGDNFIYLKRQFFSGVLPGFILFFIFSKMKYEVWKKNSKLIFGLVLFFSVLVFIPGLGIELNGARSWINIGGFTLQPAEVVKFLFIIFLAAKLTEHREEIESGVFEKSFLPFILYLLPVMLLIILQPDLGTAAVIFVAATGVYFVGGGKLRYLAILFLGVASCLVVLIKQAPYRMSRLLAFMHPESDPLGIGYHIKQSLIAVGSGGFFGLGYGNSRQKFQYLPEVQSDSIFAVMSEELGFLLVMLFLIFYFWFVFKVFVFAKKSSDNFVKLFAIGFGTWIGFQGVINIGAVLGIMPITGVPLPFISHGGSALVALLAGTGVLVSMQKRS